MERMRQLESALDAAKRHAAKAAALEQANRTLREELEAAGGGGGGGGGSTEQEVIDFMEKQVLRLSDIVRAKEEELAAMRLTIQVCGRRSEEGGTVVKRDWLCSAALRAGGVQSLLQSCVYLERLSQQAG